MTWETRTVELSVDLPPEVADMAEETAREDPEFLSRIVLYGLTRRSVYRHLAESRRHDHPVPEGLSMSAPAEFDPKGLEAARAAAEKHVLRAEQGDITEKAIAAYFGAVEPSKWQAEDHEGEWRDSILDRAYAVFMVKALPKTFTGRIRPLIAGPPQTVESNDG